MAKNVLIEDFQLSLRVSRGLSPETSAAIRRTLLSWRFRADLRHAVRVVVLKYPTLRPVRTSITI